MALQYLLQFRYSFLSVVLQLTSMVQQQTAALQAMVGALQSLSATATRTSHINSRVNARTMKRPQQDMQIPHSESELHGLRAIAESALKQILKARKAAPVSVQQAVEESIYRNRGSCVVYFQNRTSALQKNILTLRVTPTPP